MHLRNILLFVLSILLLEACSLFQDHTPDGDYYNIDGLEANLVKTLPSKITCFENNGDTLFISQIETTDSIENNYPIGIRLKFKGIGGANWNYGPYEKGGLIEKIGKIEILAIGQNKSLDITDFFRGDSSIRKHLFIEKGITNLDDSRDSCVSSNESFYFSDIPSLIKTGNQYLPEGKTYIHDIDIFFWCKQSQLKKIGFKLQSIITSITFLDSSGSGKISRQLADTIRLK